MVPRIYSRVERFPLLRSGQLFADRMAGLEHPLCLDSGHLWAATHVFDRDFVGEAEAFAATGRLKIAHFHSSACQPGTPSGGHRQVRRALGGRGGM